MTDTPYSAKFYAGIADGSRRSALRVLPILIDLVNPRTVVDVGCGVGTWLNVCRQLGIHDVTGVDGDYVDRNMLEIPDDRFVPADLADGTADAFAKPHPLLARRFDLAITLEVAEHLPVERAHGFVDLLCGLSDVVLFAAAVPHQGGTNHVNERFPSFWAAHFARHGYLPIDAVRPAVWTDENVNWWYRQNSVIYASPEALLALPPLSDARERLRDRPLDLIHPAHYARTVKWALDGWARPLQ